MNREAARWHILPLGLIVALLNEGIHFLLEKFIVKGTVPFWGEAVTFILVAAFVATLYVKIFLKDRNEEE